jgi:hypothetical protein
MRHKRSNLVLHHAHLPIREFVGTVTLIGRLVPPSAAQTALSHARAAARSAMNHVGNLKAAPWYDGSIIGVDIASCPSELPELLVV